MFSKQSKKKKKKQKKIKKNPKNSFHRELTPKLGVAEYSNAVKVCVFNKKVNTHLVF